MAKRAWCNECNCYVILTWDEICPEGHPRPALRAIEEVPDGALPAQPARRAPAPSTPAYAAQPAAAFSPAGTGGYASSVGGGTFGPPPAPSALQPAVELPPGAFDGVDLTAPNPMQRWVAPGAIAASVVLTILVALMSPLAGFVLAQFVVSTLLSAFALWAGMKLTGVDGSFLAMLVISAICAVVQWLPVIGWIASVVLLFVLISRWTSAEIWPDAVLMVFVARAVAMFGSVVLLGMLFTTLFR